jgi:LmbE family N-acetylglucosaminyl deacetylase
MATSLPSLPGETTRLTARRVLVVAPHFDDEVLGCGGLLIQLVAGGAEVRVLFLSDGCGGEEVVDDREAYAERRRGEAQGVAKLLGFAGIEELAARDGALADDRDLLADGIRKALLSHRPDLLLVPSPTEITADHRAAFLAVCEVLSPLRPEDELHTALDGVTILLYEVNHPAHPDLLIDVGAELPALEAAIRLYASQLERHNYLDCAVGLRRYRTLSLPAEVSAAEGYRRLSPGDFTTRSPSQLVEHLGGVASPRAVEGGPLVSVVVRTFNRPDLLREALASLAASHYRNLEIVLVNDGGVPPEVPPAYPFPVVRVDLSENRGRAAAAGAGIDAATGAYVSFLDDDDLVAPEHFTTLVGAASAAGVRVVYSDAAVGVYEIGPDGWRCRERRLPYSRDFDPDFLLLDNYIPFNTLLVERAACVEVGPFDSDLPFFEDWDFLIRLSTACAFNHVSSVTCEYRHFEGSEQILGRAPRQRPDFLAMKARILAKHSELLTAERLARAVDRMRAEAVECGELRRALAEQGKHLERTYTEIERRREIIAAWEQKAAALEKHFAALEKDVATLKNHFVMRLYRRLRGVDR